MKDLFTSDWHFGHEQILDFERGNTFSTIKEHDAYIIRLIANWLQHMGSDDTFYFLGDFGDLSNNNLTQLKKIFDQAECRTVAVLGNHDKDFQYEMMEWIFNKVYDNPLFISKRVAIGHMPVNVWDDEICVHGHLHGSVLDSPNFLNASIAVCGYKPLTTVHVQKALSKVRKRNRRFLWEPWAEQYKFTQPKDSVVCDKEGHVDLAASRALQQLSQGQKSNL